MRWEDHASDHVEDHSPRCAGDHAKDRVEGRAACHPEDRSGSLAGDRSAHRAGGPVSRRVVAGRAAGRDTTVFFRQ